MIRWKVNRWYYGQRVKPNDPVIASNEVKNALVECNQAYDDNIESEQKPDMSNTKQEIIDYLNGHYIEHNEKDTKAELLELI